MGSASALYRHIAQSFDLNRKYAGDSRHFPIHQPPSSSAYYTMTEDSSSKTSAFFIDRLVQPLLGGLNPSFAPVSENGKPGLSINLMTRNFRRFSARVGVIFMVQNKIEDVLAWRNPIETISAMMIFSLITINPYLLIPFPLFLLIFALLIPSYQARHPAPPLTLSNVPVEVTQATSPPPQPAKPVPELSRDFFMNMRDIQNVMDDFSSVYDIVRGYVLYLTTFTDEPLSSTILAFSALGSIGLILFVHFLPVRWIILIVGNAAILLCNPVLFRYITTTYVTPEEIEKVKKRIETFIKEDYIPPPPSQSVTFIVEIFESRRLLPPVPPNYLPDWSASNYSPFPPQLTTGTNKLAVVSPPPGFVFTEEDWKVDENKVRWARERGLNDETGFWIADEDDLDREVDGWVVYEAGGWKVRRLTRAVVRAVD